MTTSDPAPPSPQQRNLLRAKRRYRERIGNHQVDTDGHLIWHKDCEWCGLQFAAKTKLARLCSVKCRAQFRYRNAFREFTCKICGETFKSRQRTAECCSIKCTSEASRRALTGRSNPHRIHASRRDAYRIYSNQRRLSKSNGEREPYNERDIFERDGWLCQLCFEEVDRSLTWPHRMCATIDHVIPISKGGRDAPHNVQLAHLSCNSRKGSRISQRSVNDDGA